jgi:putative ABC transport system substrate-binding protein
MRRREFVQLAATTGMTWPLAGHAQQPERVRRVGVLMGFSENDPFSQRSVSAFAQALRSLGWVEGKNIVIDYRFAAGDPTLYNTYAAELVGLAPDAILASPGTSVVALQEQSTLYRSYSYLCPIPSGKALFRASRGPAATSRGSAPSTRR